MGTAILIDAGGKEPPYEQLRQQLIDQIMSRQLPPGAKLPTVRGLAQELGLAANTVARAYRELEAEGYLATQGRNGTRVADVASGSPAELRRAELLAEECVRELRKLGLADESIRAILSRAIGS